MIKVLAGLTITPHPILAFFDIHLGDGHSFEIFEGSEVNCPVIFTTAYEKYAIKAGEHIRSVPSIKLSAFTALIRPAIL